jgi:hypothetical protein
MIGTFGWCLVLVHLSRSNGVALGNRGVSSNGVVLGNIIVSSDGVAVGNRGVMSI